MSLKQVSCAKLTGTRPPLVSSNYWLKTLQLLLKSKEYTSKNLADIVASKLLVTSITHRPLEFKVEIEEVSDTEFDGLHLLINGVQTKIAVEVIDT
jgi:hypothetical protein